MERKEWTLRIAGIIVICVVILAVVIIIMLSGMVSNGFCHAHVTLQHPVSIGENVWRVEVENVIETEGCSRDVEHFGVALERDGSSVAVSYQLHNGLVARSDPIVIFFADYGKLGKIDTGDLFYLVNLETESEYDFHVLDGSSKAGFVTVYT